MLSAALLMITQPRLVLDQDFSTMKTIDESVWSFYTGPVYNNERQTYTPKSAGNVFLEGGALVIEARKEGGKITSGKLESKQAWKYGRFEVVCKVPSGKGTWPAVWMLNEKIRAKVGNVPWPRCGEIDIMENVGYDGNKYHFTLHSEKYNHMKGTQRGFSKVVDEATPGWHKYVMDWQPNHIKISMDQEVILDVTNKETSVEAWPFEEPFFMILNLAMGGDWGAAQGFDESIMPCRFLIKSVKIYQ